MARTTYSFILVFPFLIAGSAFGWFERGATPNALAVGEIVSARIGREQTLAIYRRNPQVFDRMLPERLRAQILLSDTLFGSDTTDRWLCTGISHGTFERRMLTSLHDINPPRFGRPISRVADGIYADLETAIADKGHLGVREAQLTAIVNGHLPGFAVKWAEEKRRRERFSRFPPLRRGSPLSAPADVPGAQDDLIDELYSDNAEVVRNAVETLLEADHLTAEARFALERLRGAQLPPCVRELLPQKL